MSRRALVICAALLVSCASAPKPRALTQLESARSAPAVRESARLAPQAHARAEQLRRRAQRAYDEGDRAGAQILSEHALAAYQRATVLSRLLKAEQELARANQRLSKAQSTLSSLDEQLKRVSAEADDLELRVKVARDAEPLAASAPASPEREQARREAAAALATQARLLCTAARLLEPKRTSLAEHDSELDSIDKIIAGRAQPAPIDQAVRLRSRCLRELSTIRRATPPSDAAAADALLAELSKSGDLFPFRDDRGVVITLRGLFDGPEQLSSEGRTRLTLLGRVAKAHPRFPVLVVVHSARPGSQSADQRRAEQVAAALKGAGAAQVETRSAATTLPVTDPKRPASRERNERVEIVFVSPS